MTTFSEVQQFIATADRVTLEGVQALINARHSALRVERDYQAISAIKVGSRVRLTGLSPKYLNGCIGTVEAPTNGKRGPAFQVLLDHKPSSRYSRTVVVPAGCCVPI